LLSGIRTFRALAITLKFVDVIVINWYGIVWWGNVKFSFGVELWYLYDFSEKKYFMV